MTHKGIERQSLHDILPEREGGGLSVTQVFPNISIAEQNKGENIYLVMRKHAITNFGWIFWGVVLILLPFFLLFSGEFIINFFSGAGLSLGLIKFSYLLLAIFLWYMFVLTYLFVKFVTWYYNIYIITSERVIDYDFSPLASYKISEAGLDKIEDATQHSVGFFPAIFDYGDVYIQTAAHQREFDFHALPRPSWVRDKLMDLVILAKESE